MTKHFFLSVHRIDVQVMMSTSFELKTAKQADERSKLLVFGYIRNINDTQQISTNISDLIWIMILIYYMEHEYFDSFGDDLQLSNDKKMVTKIKRDNNWDNNCYGIIEIASTNNNCIYEWKFKIKLSSGDCGHCVIGITAEEHTPNIDFEENDGCHYALSSTGFNYTQKYDWITQCDDFSHNDHVTLQLNMAQKEIRYLTDDEDLGIIYKNINHGDDVIYRLFVAINAIGDSIEITDFSKRYST